MKKKLFNSLFFFAVMGLTVYIVYKDHDAGEILNAIQSSDKEWLIPAAALAILFVLCEGLMIRKLLGMLGHKNSLFRCFSYSFIGYFYSGVTPSASGGQPMQLYYMKKDGNGVSDSSVVLLTVAFFSRLVLTVIGVLLLLFFHKSLLTFFQGYYFVYWLGLSLNTLVAFAILAVMVWPGMTRKFIRAIEKLLVRFRVFRQSAERVEKIESGMDGYKAAVQFMARHKSAMVYLFLITFSQRFTLYFLTWFVYKSFGLSGAGLFRVVLLQAAIYVSVEMLPLPGAQGITELLYQNVFGGIFGAFLAPSMLVVRGMDFYLLMIIGLVFVIFRFFKIRRSAPTDADGV